MKTTNLKQTSVAKPRKWFQRRRRWHDPREARPEGSQFLRTGWIAQLVHTVWSVVAPRFDRTGCRLRRSGDALRAQHPEWIEADGKSATCDYYESRFAELLLSHLAHARALTNKAAANSSIPVGYAEARNIVFPEMALAIG
jgi:hypothetical protein